MRPFGTEEDYGERPTIKTIRIISSLVLSAVMALAPLAGAARVSSIHEDLGARYSARYSAAIAIVTPPAPPRSATSDTRSGVTTPAAFPAPVISRGLSPSLSQEARLDPTEIYRPAPPKASDPDIDAIPLPSPRRQAQRDGIENDHAADHATDRTADLERVVATPPRKLPKDDDLICLAAALYHEARNQEPAGRIAVAATIMNRAALEPWPETICDVIAQPKQFSFMRKNRIIPKIREKEAWAVAVGEAAMILMMGCPPNLDGVAYYHAASVKPVWRKSLSRMAQIGDHIFYTNRK